MTETEKARARLDDAMLEYVASLFDGVRPFVIEGELDKYDEAAAAYAAAIRAEERERCGQDTVLLDALERLGHNGGVSLGSTLGMPRYVIAWGRDGNARGETVRQAIALADGLDAARAGRVTPKTFAGSSPTTEEAQG